MCRVFEEITKKQSTKSWLRPSCNPPCMLARFTTPWPLPLWPLHTDRALFPPSENNTQSLSFLISGSGSWPQQTRKRCFHSHPGTASRDYRMFDVIVNFHCEHSIVPTSSSCPYSEERGCLRNCPRIPSFLLHPSGRKNVLRKLLRIACVCLRLFVSFCESSDWDWMKYTRCDRLLLLKALFFVCVVVVVF